MGQKGNLAVLTLIVFIIISIIATLGSFLIHNRLGLWPWDLITNQPLSAKQLEKRANSFQRSYPEVIKGNWEPSSFHMTRMLSEDIYRIKDLGVNTVSVSVEYSLNKDGTPFLRDENQMVSNIVKAKEKGLAVLVAPNFVGPGGHDFNEEGIDITKEKYLQISEEVALKWAAISEKYQVEFFAPQNEFNGMIGGNFAQSDEEIAQITSDWHREVLPKIKAVYSGKTMMKLSTVQKGTDAIGYDLVGITIFHGNDELAEFRKRIRQQYQILQEVAEKSRSEWLISEAWFAYGGPFFQQTQNKAGESLDELQDDYFKVSLDEYLRITEDKPVGYIFIAWIMPGMDIKNRPAERLIKEYFDRF
ncbi:hypothetical protein HYZ05_01325 [Candidatus Daviesbacteria bacterium]|nr:hypothetical protein [Candidatus Daviesbacteria bacterium]